MYRTIIITTLCGGILVGSVIGGSYMIANAIRQAGDRQVNVIQSQVNAIQDAADQQSRAAEQAEERAHQKLERCLEGPVREFEKCSQQ